MPVFKASLETQARRDNLVIQVTEVSKALQATMVSMDKEDLLAFKVLLESQVLVSKGKGVIKEIEDLMVSPVAMDWMVGPELRERKETEA